MSRPALQGGERGQGEPFRVGVPAQLSAVAHRRKPVDPVRAVERLDG
jgi:hypothetical protein